MNELHQTPTYALVKELESRGWRARPVSFNHKVMWNRIVDENFDEEIFKWEAVHKIAGQLIIDHLRFDCRIEPMGKKIISGTLELF